MGCTCKAQLQKQRLECKIDCVEGISINKLTTDLTLCGIVLSYCRIFGSVWGWIGSLGSLKTIIQICVLVAF